MSLLKENHKKALHHHGQKASQKLTDLVHKSHFHKVVLHNKKNETIMKFPLLLGIIVTILFPLLIAFLLLLFLIYGGNLVVEKEE